MKETSREFLKKLFDFSVGPIISAILGFIIVPVTTYLVTPMDFGKAAMYTMGYSISSLFIFLGLDQAFVREYNEVKNREKLFFNSLMLPLSFSILLGIFYILFYESISLLMFGSVEKYIIVILSLSLPFAVIDRFNLLLLRMEEKARIYSLFTILNKLLSLLILIPYLTFIDKSFKGIINATFINLVIICVIESFFVRHIWKNKISIDRALIKKLLHFGLPLIPATIIGWFFSSMDRIALRQWASFEEIGIYSAAFRIVMILGIVQQAFCTFWTPTAFRWYREKVANEKYMEVSRYLQTLMISVFVFLILFKDIIIKILSSNYSDASRVIPFLLFFPIMYTVSETTTLGISFSRKTGYNIVISGVSVLVNYVGNYILVPKLGAVGASISTGISYMVFFWMRTLISRKLWFAFELKIYFLNNILMFLFALNSITINHIAVSGLLIFMLYVVNRESIGKIFSLVRSVGIKGIVKKV